MVQLPPVHVSNEEIAILFPRHSGNTENVPKIRKTLQRRVKLLIGVNELGTQSRVRSLYNLWLNQRSSYVVHSYKCIGRNY